jgi:hypothetical protein
LRSMTLKGPTYLGANILINEIADLKAEVSSLFVRITLLPSLGDFHTLVNHLGLLLCVSQYLGSKHLTFNSLTPE